MDANTIIAIVIAVIAAAPGTIALIIAFRKAKPEISVLDADAAIKYSDLVDRAAKRESEYQSRIDSLNSRVAQVEAQYGELREQVALANKRADKFEDWAKRLAWQVQSLGGVPVPLETKK